MGSDGTIPEYVYLISGTPGWWWKF